METDNKQKNPLTDSKPFSLFNLFVIFLKYRKKILILTAIFCVISIVIYFFILDQIYFSTAVIRSSGQNGGLLNTLESNLSDLGGLSDIGLATSSSAKELAYYQDILTSRRCLEPLIDKFELMNRENYRYKEDAVKDFSKSQMVMDEDRLAGTLSVGVFDKNPQLAKEMVDFLLSQLDKINVEVKVLNAKNNREFIERRYFQARQDLTKAEDSLKSFQLIYGVSPDLQVKAAAQTEFSIESELKAEEVKLDVLKKILSPEQIEIKTQEAKINALQEQINKIQNSTDLNDALRLGNSPQIVMSFLRLERDIEIQSKIVTFLLPVYEQAKIEEKKETPTIMVLDKPYVAERKSKPKRLPMVIIFTFAGFMVGLSLSVVYEYYLSRKAKITELINNKTT